MWVRPTRQGSEAGVGRKSEAVSSQTKTILPIRHLVLKRGCVDKAAGSRHGDYFKSAASNQWRKIIASRSTRFRNSLSTRFRAMQHRNFQLFIAGQLTSLVGTWMQTTAQLWLVYRLTGSAALLGIFGFASQLPMLFLSSLGGYLGDHYNRHRGVISTQSVSMVLAFVLATLTRTGEIRGWRGAWVVIGIAFLVGMVNAFDVPIRQAFLVQMVGKEDLPNAIALNSSIFNGARVVGPAIAGFAIAWLGEGWCFFFERAELCCGDRSAVDDEDSENGDETGRRISAEESGAGLPIRHRRPSDTVDAVITERSQSLWPAILGVHADLRPGHSERKCPDARIADEFGRGRRGAGRAAFCGAHKL